MKKIKKIVSMVAVVAMITSMLLLNVKANEKPEEKLWFHEVDDSIFSMQLNGWITGKNKAGKAVQIEKDEAHKRYNIKESGNYVISQDSLGYSLFIAKDLDVTLLLDNVTIDANREDQPAIEVENDSIGNTTMLLKGKNVLKTYGATVIQKGMSEEAVQKTNGELVIDCAEKYEDATHICGEQGDSEAYLEPGTYKGIGAGIGGSVSGTAYRSTSNITISGSIYTLVNNYFNIRNTGAALIGSADSGIAKNININGYGTSIHADLEIASSRLGSAIIGSGKDGIIDGLRISGHGVSINAITYGYGAGIGGGQDSIARNIYIGDEQSYDLQVTAVSNYGAGIGGGVVDEHLPDMNLENLNIGGHRTTISANSKMGAAIGGGDYTQNTYFTFTELFTNRVTVSGIHIQGEDVTINIPDTFPIYNTTSLGNRNGGAGIGTGYFGGIVEDITISGTGHTITARGGIGAAGIGAGVSYSKEGSEVGARDISITASDSIINAIGGKAGEAKVIEVYNGLFTGSGAGIGGSGYRTYNRTTDKEYYGSGVDTVEIDAINTVINAQGGSLSEILDNSYSLRMYRIMDQGAAGIGGGTGGGNASNIQIKNGTVNATGSLYGVGIGGGMAGLRTSDRDYITDLYTLPAGNVDGIYISGGNVIAKAGGYQKNTEAEQPEYYDISSHGVAGAAGIGAGAGGNFGITDTKGNIKLNALSAGNAKNIEISGGVVTAYGADDGGAGIGASVNADATITPEIEVSITGGRKVTAEGGIRGGAGIGGAADKNASKINVDITGGTIIAKANEAAAYGLGSGSTENKEKDEVKIKIQGGSVNAYNSTSNEMFEEEPNPGLRYASSSVQPVNETGETVYRSLASFPEAIGVAHMTSVQIEKDGTYTFGDKDIWTDEQQTLYFWLPQGNKVDAIVTKEDETEWDFYHKVKNDNQTLLKLGRTVEIEGLPTSVKAKEKQEVELEAKISGSNDGDFTYEVKTPKTITIEKTIDKKTNVEIYGEAEEPYEVSAIITESRYWHKATTNVTGKIAKEQTPSRPEKPEKPDKPENPDTPKKPEAPKQPTEDNKPKEPVKKEEITQPDTSDTTKMGLLITLLVISCLGVGVLVYKKRKH